MEGHDLRFLGSSHPVSKLEATESLRWVSLDCILQGCGITDLHGGEPQTTNPLPSLSSSIPRSAAAIPGSNAAALEVGGQIESVATFKCLPEFSRLRPLIPHILTLLTRLRCEFDSLPGAIASKKKVQVPLGRYVRQVPPRVDASVHDLLQISVAFVSFGKLQAIV